MATGCHAHRAGQSTRYRHPCLADSFIGPADSCRLHGIGGQHMFLGRPHARGHTQHFIFLRTVNRGCYLWLLVIGPE